MRRSPAIPCSIIIGKCRVSGCFLKLLGNFRSSQYFEQQFHAGSDSMLATNSLCSLLPYCDTMWCRAFALYLSMFYACWCWPLKAPISNSLACIVKWSLTESGPTIMLFCLICLLVGYVCMFCFIYFVVFLFCFFVWWCYCLGGIYSPHSPAKQEDFEKLGLEVTIVPWLWALGEDSSLEIRK